MLMLAFSTVSMATSLQVTWQPDTDTDLAGYNVYYAGPLDLGWSMKDGEIKYTLGSLPNKMQAQGTLTTLNISNVSPGAYAVAVSAFDTSGNESILSEIKSIYVPDPPKVIVVPPVNIPPGQPVQVVITIQQ